jgi:Sulfotransferase family
VFTCFTHANTLYRAQRASCGERFDAAQLRAQVDDPIAIDKSMLFSAVAGWGSPSETPVFVIGMPRSGTSLVEQIAASHPRVFGSGERRDVCTIFNTLVAQNRSTPIEEWDPISVRRLADRYVGRLQKLGNGAARVIDKMPDNVFALWWITVLLPSARVVYYWQVRQPLYDRSVARWHHYERHLPPLLPILAQGNPS